MNINKALRYLRVHLTDRTIAQLGLELDLSKSYISEIENCKKVPTLEVIKKYADYIGVPCSSIIYLAETITMIDKNNMTPKNITSTDLQVDSKIPDKIQDLIKLLRHKYTNDLRTTESNNHFRSELRNNLGASKWS